MRKTADRYVGGEKMTTKIVIIDDHQLFREGVKRILEFEKFFFSCSGRGRRF